MVTPRRPGPRLRHLEFHPSEHAGQRGLLLRDPLGIAAEAFVPEGLIPLLARCDGKASIAGLQRQVPGAPAGFVAKLVDQLDEALLLDSPRFATALATAVREFGAREVRPARHAGSAGYPAAREAAEAALGAMISRRTRREREAPRGLIAPHIDLARGREGYVMAYGYLAETTPADLYVIFGTGHHGPGAPVTGLAMDWETPLGRVRTDSEFVQAVHARLGPADPLDLFLHQHEHSLEFQVLMLQHVLHGQEFAVAGFLCGSLPSRSGDPGQEQYVQEILATFRAAAASKRVCFIAGADLAHIGPHFGDPEPVDDLRLDELARTERGRLAHLEQGNPGAFHAGLEAEGNPDRVCGATPIYLAAALASGSGEVLHYGQARAPGGQQCVSFCSVAFG